MGVKAGLWSWRGRGVSCVPAVPRWSWGAYFSSGHRRLSCVGVAAVRLLLGLGRTSVAEYATFQSHGRDPLHVLNGAHGPQP